MGGLESPSDLLLGLIQDIERRFHDACVRKKYDFADILLEVCYLDPISLELCHLSLAHLLNQKNVPADWMLYVLDARSSKIPLPTWLSKNLFTSAASSSMQAYYLEEIKVLMIFDLYNKKAIYWADDTEALLESEKIFPFRHIVNMIFRIRGGLTLHSAAVGRDGVGVLIVGNGGVGKSTLSLAALYSEMQFVSDDCCLYYGGSVYSVTQFAKLNTESLSLIPQINPDEFKERNLKGKIILPLYPRFKNKLVNSLKVKALIVLNFSSQGSSNFSECSSGAALLAMAPSTLAQIYGGHAREMKAMARLVSEVPAYRLTVGSDMDHAIELVDEIIALSI